MTGKVTSFGFRAQSRSRKRPGSLRCMIAKVSSASARTRLIAPTTACATKTFTVSVTKTRTSRSLASTSAAKTLPSVTQSRAPRSDMVISRSEAE